MAMSIKTTIEVSREVRDALAARGTMKDSYDTVLRSMLGLKEKKESLSDRIGTPGQTATAATTRKGGHG